MKNLLDMHTHTVASGHAYSTIQEMAAAAGACGLSSSALQNMRRRCRGHVRRFILII